MSLAVSLRIPGFGGLGSAPEDVDSAKTVVVPIPYDGTTSFRTGTREGPEAILQASCNMELFDEELRCSPCESGIVTVRAIETDARGPQQMMQTVREAILPLVKDGKFVVVLGGEHSITGPCVEAQQEGTGRDFCVLQIDAHADLRDSYQGSPYSHACVMRRLIQKMPVVQVGIRSFSAEEYHFIKERKLELFTMERIRATPDWITQVVDRLGPNVYVSIDLDGFDPGGCPGVGTPEPGGLSWHEALGLLRQVFARRQVVAADVVECLPLAGQQVTEFLAARLVYKMIGYRFESLKST